MTKMNVIMVTIMMMMMMLMVIEGNKIELACKATPDFNLCVSLLKSDPKGVSADTSGLALIITNKIKELATKTMNEINGLYKTRPELKQALDECSRRYTTILNAGVPQAIEAFTKGNPKLGERGIVMLVSKLLNVKKGLKENLLCPV